MDYGVLDYGDMNWLAILCAGLTYWLPRARFGIPLYLVRRGAQRLDGTASNWASVAKVAWRPN